MTTAQNEPAGIVKKFRIEGKLTEISPLGTGHINETYSAAFKTPDGQRRYIFQRVNENVFKGIPALMENMDRVTRHLRAGIEKRGGDPDRETLNLVPTLEGKTFLRDDEGRSRLRRFKGLRKIPKGPLRPAREEDQRCHPRFSRHREAI